MTPFCSSQVQDIQHKQHLDQPEGYIFLRFTFEALILREFPSLEADHGR